MQSVQSAVAAAVADGSLAERLRELGLELVPGSVSYVTNNNAAPPAPAPDSSGGGLSTGAIVGIAVGAAVGVAALGALPLPPRCRCRAGLRCFFLRVFGGRGAKRAASALPLQPGFPRQAGAARHVLDPHPSSPSTPPAAAAERYRRPPVLPFIRRPSFHLFAPAGAGAYIYMRKKKNSGAEPPQKGDPMFSSGNAAFEDQEAGLPDPKGGKGRDKVGTKLP